MEIVYTVFALLFGLVFGSFFNVVGLRVPKKESIVNPPSHCTSCNRRLTALDLVPVFSYLFLKGKCRTCGVKISPIYCVTELVTGLLFAFATWQLGIVPELFVALLFISLLVIIVVSDIAYMLIPDKILLFFLPFLLIGRLVSPLTPWWDSLLGAVIGFGILFLIAIISKGGMGGGDIKLFFLIGLVLGTIHTLLTLFLASVIGMVVGLIVLKAKGQGRKTPVPFGPSIAAAAIIVYFYGHRMIDWYMNLLL
ncbi:leader peptidase (prepilin peptidase)/N-methyltransferase [Lysinibacillus composti]|uniref:Prepilin peptidase n=1 Tax=Lysinibacillus composti TaxID=720633 RepID=A0A3N9UDR5_9BACI|nr:A24 family peptidase [Lysinibacillus composti]MBM7608814.1 leader peptidase (prepilin peptidase)/N-methyltransferase [Lysinibacillus composti]RQW74397.1 prepilin peptidase [Lysinibacillus composti]